MEKDQGLFSFRKHPAGNFLDGKKGRKRKGGRLRRSMGFLLAAALICNTLPASGFAVSASEQETGLCEHHTEHTAECGYAKAQPCTHEHGEECYKTVTECVHEHTDECYPETGETEESTGEGNAAASDAGNREPSLCTHVCKSSEAGLEESGCITKVLDCHHEHDESCGYQEAQECGYVCDICNGTEPEDTGENTENTKDAGMDMAECICKVLCTEDSINGDCPVCGAGGDSLLDCKGKVSEENTEEQEDTGICKHHQEHDADCGYIAKSEDGEGSPCTYECRICPVEDLIAALPNEVTEDNRDEVEAQLREILTLYGNLTEEEQEQTDISRCLALRDQLDALDGQPGEHEAALAAEMTGVKYLNESGEEETCPSATVVETSTTWKSGWYVVSGTVTLSGRVYISGDVHLILADGCHLDASSGGIDMRSGKSLTIYAQSTGNSMGALTAAATSTGYAGIGGDSASSCGTITINGGKITATGGDGTNTAAGSGIGCGYSGSAATITINGGEVTATGGSSSLRGGAGIGATSPGASGVVITITGGTVNATGGNSTNNHTGGSGIGIGVDSYYGGTVTINGGEVTAAGGSGNPAGAALCAGKSQVEYWGGTVNGTEYHSYYVTFDTTGAPEGVTFAPPQQRVHSDELVTRPPEVEGWIVTWHVDSTSGSEFDFTKSVSQDTTLYATWEANMNYVAKVTTIEGDETSYTTLNAAWAALTGKAGTITLLRDVDTNGTTLVVESGMDVTVEMSAGMALTNSTADCFQVKGGALTLASGRVIENHSDCSVVYAASGTLRMTGAVCQSTGNGLWVDSGVTVRLSGGAINVPSGKIALRYGSKAVKDMLAAGCALQVNGGNWIPLTQLDQEKLNGGNYTVGACDSTETVSHSNGDGTHTLGGCPYCGIDAVVGPHTFDEGSCTCKDCNTPMVVKVEADGAATYYEDINAAWDALPTGKSSVTVLADTSHEECLEVGSGQDVTVNMPDGVTLTHNAQNSSTLNSCFYVNGGALTLESGKVVDTGTSNYRHFAMYIGEGQLYVKGGTYTSAGNSYGSCVYAATPSKNPTIRLTGGTLSGTSHVLYWNSTQGMVKTMLAEGYALKSGETFITLDTLNTYQFNYSSPCTVVECPHGDSACTSNLDGTHTMGACIYCDLSEGKTEPHTLKEDSNVCAGCGAEMVAEVTVNGTPTYYEGIDRAWGSLTGKTGTITLLQNVTLGKALKVESGMNVTVKMNDGVTYTTTDGDCFHVSGGTLNLTDSCTVAKGGGNSAHSIVDIEAGTLNVTGGTYTSDWDGFSAGSAAGAAICLTGGHITAANKTLCYNATGGQVKTMLGAGYRLFDLQDNTKVEVSALETQELQGGGYGVELCGHEKYSAYVSNKNGTHHGICAYCGNCKAEWKCSYGTKTNGTASCQVCKSELTVTVNDGGVVYDGTAKTPDVTVAVDGETLPAEAYSLEYSGNTNAGAGTASVTVTGKAFDGTCTQTFTVNQATPIITAAPSAVNRIYNPAKALEKGELNGGEAAGVDHGPLQGTWDWKHPNIVPAVNNSGYMAVFTPEDTKNYTTAEANVTVNVEKAVPYIAVPPSASAVTYGDNLAISTLTGGSAQYGDGKGKPGTGTDSAAAVAGSFAWKDKDVKPSVADSGKTEYAIIFTPENTQNYSLAETALTLTVNKAEKAPDMPPAAMNVSNSVEKVGSVPLPEGWEWQEPDRDKVLEPDTAVTAVAVYNGADKGNYINETVTVVITRSACEHTAGGILYTGAGEKAPSCTEDGLGHRECTKCHAVLEKDITVPALGHDYNEGEVTKEPTVESEGEKTYTCRRCGHTYTEAVPKKIPQGLWIDGLQPSVPYTGYAIRQEGIRVYYGDTPLRENTDYAISYKNNTNAGDAQIIVTGKGNYTGKTVRTYTIEPADIGTDSGITAIVTTVTETGKKLKPAAAVTWNGKKLKENTDYTLSYNTDIKTAGDYDITITGKRNYTGTIVKVFHVKPKGTKLLNSAKVAGIKKSYPYQGGTLESDLQDITVKIGKTTLAKGTDYTVRTENTQAVGTAAVIIEASPESAYAGEKRITIVITGTDLRKGSIKGVEKSYPYTGAPVTPQITVYSGKNGSGEMIPADAYTVTYSGNINKGKADVTATGIPAKGYSGSVKVSYQIGRLDLWTEKAAGNIKVTMPAVINHAKGGAKPQPVVTYTNNGTTRTLREGADYTLKYSNNMTAAGTKTPTVKIAGIGNYSGSITENYTISAQDIGRLSVTVTDRAYGKNKKGSYYHSAPKVYDLDGKQLKSGKDYTVQYTYADNGEPVGRNDKIEAGTKLCATVTAAAKSSYTGTQRVTYLVREAKEVKDIAKARNDKIAPQQYTGSAVTPGVRLYIQNGKTKNYLTDEDYEVTGWYNNTKRGTATILVRGKGAYSGVKCITFKIVQKNIK